MNLSELTQNKMGYKPMLPLLLGMSLPAMFSMMIQALYNVVDSIFVANFSSKALTAVSLAYPMQLVSISFAVGTAVGVNSLIARRLGAKNYQEANAAATTGVILGVINWVVFLLIGLFFSSTFISWFTDDPVVREYGTQYLSIVLCVSIGMMVGNMGEKILQSTGNMIIPMLTQLLGAVTNIIFDPLLIFGIGPFPKLGVVGAAVATVFGQICSMVFVLLILIFKKNAVELRFKGFRMNGQIVKNIYVVGVPAIIMQSIGSVMVSGINGIISAAQVTRDVANAYINAFGAYFKLQSFVFMPVFGLTQGTSPIIGYNYGARNKKRMYSALRIATIIAVGIMAAGTLLFQLDPEWLLSWFSSENASANDLMLAVGVPTLRTISLSFIFAAFGIMISTLFQAVGKGFYSMIMSFSRQLVVVLPVAFFLSQISLDTMWYAFPIAEVGSLIIGLIFFMILRNKQFKALDQPA
ncbi:MAG: MATE family efflux transporter [Ruminococcus sp.]|nr:MATE family efflux transporter [Ruminococcus sp.]